MKLFFYINKFKISLFVIVMSLMVVLGSCHYFKKEEKELKQTLITITQKPTKKVLYFSSNLNPIANIPVISPEEGIISKLHFDYGQHVDKGQLLFSIKSLKQQTNFQTTLSNYLKAKQELNSSQGKMHETTTLFKQGLVSRNEYEQDKNSYFLNRLSFLQAETELKELMQFQEIKDITSLKISDYEKIDKILALGKKAEIQVKAPHSGIALFPTKNGNTDGKMKTGSEIKQGQVLVDLGDMSGAILEIKVNEMDINQIKPGQKVLITSDAFPNITLKGYIKSVDAQATITGSIPNFSVNLVIPKLTPEQQKVIHVGMSAKIAIELQKKPFVTVPINAIIRQNDETFVNVMDKQTKQIKLVPVVTGETTFDSVIITSGLNPGDQVVIRH